MTALVAAWPGLAQTQAAKADLPPPCPPVQRLVWQAPQRITWQLAETPLWFSLGHLARVLAFVPVETASGTGVVVTAVRLELHDVLAFEPGTPVPRETSLVRSETIRADDPKARERKKGWGFPTEQGSDFEFGMLPALEHQALFRIYRHDESQFWSTLMVHTEARLAPVPQSLAAAAGSTQAFTDFQSHIIVCELLNDPSLKLTSTYIEPDDPPSTDWIAKEQVRAPWSDGKVVLEPAKGSLEFAGGKMRFAPFSEKARQAAADLARRKQAQGAPDQSIRWAKEADGAEGDLEPGPRLGGPGALFMLQTLAQYFFLTIPRGCGFIGIMVKRSSGREPGTRIRGIPLKLHLDRTRPDPMHVQLYAELRRCIRDGTLPSGSLLPSVQWLCQTYSLSTTTVSRVLRELKLEGAISTTRGAGCLVNALPPPVTEVVVSGEGPIQLSPQSFYYDLIVGLKRGFADPGRHFVLTHYDERLPASDELTALMQLRHADGLVVYRPGPPLAEGLRQIARLHPIVSLLTRPQAASVDCVLCDPGEALRQLVTSRIAKGRRTFAFFGKRSLLHDDSSPYSRLLQAFRGLMRDAGLKPFECILNDEPHTVMDANRLLAEQAAGLPGGAVVLTGTPHIGETMYRQSRRFDLISYTESPDSVSKLGGMMTLLFMGLDRVGAAAADLLREPQPRPARKPRVVSLVPDVIPPGQAAQRESRDLS